MKAATAARERTDTHMKRSDDIIETGREILPDGTTVISFERGGRVIVPPPPTDPAWIKRASREMSELNYQIMRESAAEKQS